ncbi:unnamed protein product [Brugia timori]|uniref:SERPIN domain-containing protein n=1 Tax=Brugia timori TaxID=42155 RepID=A0A0R3QMK5_9BILA|nr:unnamed protein product [Brugia timori]
MKLFEVIFIVVAVLGGSSRANSTLNHCSENNDDSNKLLITKAQMNFALELLRYSSQADETSLLSPFAIASVMSLLYEGARGETEREMGRVLSADQPKNAFGAYIECAIKNIHKQSKRNDYSLYYLTKFFVQQNSLKSDFKDITRRRYPYELTQINFASPLQVKSIREIFIKWIKKSMNYGARNIASITSTQSLNLFNGIHFTDDWMYEFLPLNHILPFYSPRLRITDMPMMERTAKFPYYENQHMQAVSLPFKDSEMQMLIILPKKTFDLAKFEDKLTGEELFSYISALDSSHEITVTIPKFKYENQICLLNGLKRMGVQSMFHESNDFSGIFEQRLFTMDDIRNHAYIKIDEKGINNENSSMPVRNDMVMDKGEAFRANHPFLYAIIDNHGTVLWIGRFTGKNRETIVENSDDSMQCEETPKKRQRL